MKVPENKVILDACCGPRFMWFNKKHPNALYIDIRQEDRGFHPNRPNMNVTPDILMDFRKMDFPDGSFKLVVWDPPHLKSCGPKSQLGMAFGCLKAETWQSDLKKGFDECWRVLQDYGILVLKWSDHDISSKRLLLILKKQPLFGNISRGTKGEKSSRTYWYCFMKIPGEPS